METSHPSSPPRETNALQAAAPPTATIEEEPTDQIQQERPPQDIPNQAAAPPSTLKRKRQHNDNGDDEKKEQEGEKPEEADTNGGEDENKQKPQQQQQHPLRKTSLCSYFRRSAASCSHGSSCRYAHGEAELRPRPDGTWDPTSEKGKSVSAKKPLPHRHDPESDSSPLPVQDILAISEDEGEGEPADDRRLDKCIIGIPMKWTSEKLQAFLDSQGVVCKTVRKKKGMTVGFLGFEDESQLNKAIKGLSGKSIGGKDIKISDVIRRPYVKKPKFQVPVDGVALDEAEGGESVDCNAGDPVPRMRRACDTVVPLAHMLYGEQLEYKKSSLIQILKRLTRNARKACPGSVPLPEWIHKSREIGGLPCEFEGIIPSPLTNGYRNKCEFTVGYALDGKQTVGFALGNFREGMIAVEEPSDCCNISEISCKYAMIFQEFLYSSVLPVWNRLNNTGFWRQLTVREGRNLSCDTNIDSAKVPIAEVMLIIQVCSLDVDDELMKSEFKTMAKMFALGARSCSPPLPLTALVVQDHKGICNAAPADCPLFPLTIPNMEDDSSMELITEARIHDFLCNLKFSISPTAFFQVNTLAAEKLYSLAGDWASLTPKTLLFDICCGTGTIGLTLAHRVGLVVGIEMNHSAVLDAQNNADINCIANCRFICAKAEDVMGNLLKEYASVDQLQETSSSKDDANDTSDEVDHLAGPSESSLAVNGTKSLACPGGTETHPFDLMNGSECPSKSCISEHKEAGSKDSICEDKEGISLPLEKDAGAGDGLCKEKEGISTPLQKFEDVVVIVDPPRAGLHPVVIRALRTHPHLRRLVYISCNPETLMANAIELCTPTAEDREKVKGNKWWRKMSSAGLARHRIKSMPHSEPFRPVRAMAVDMFPHTPHCEMVMLFER